MYFGPIDPVAKTGTYLPILRSHEPRSWVRFAVVREEADGEEMVIREIDEQGNATAPADTILRVPKEGGALVRVSMTQERPLLAVYYPIGHKRTHEAGVRPAP